MIFKSPFDYADPFGDTTADIGLPVAQKPVQGNVGISPITMQGAVSIPAEPQSSFNFLDEANRISQEGMKSYNYYNNKNNFDPGNRIFGTNSVADATLGATADKYIDLYNNNSEAPPVLKQENGELYVLRLPDIKEGLNPVGTVVRGLYGQEAYGVIKDMDFTGSPKVGEYYKLKQREGDFIDKYVEPLAFAALSIVNPAMGAFAAGSKVASEGGNLGDIAKAAAGAYIGGQAGSGQGMFAGVGSAVTSNATLASAISAGTASGVATAVQGGDLGDVVKSGLLGGLGGYAQGLGAEAAKLEQAAQAAGAAGDYSTSIALTMQARDMTQQLGLMNTISNSASAIDAISNKNYAGALNFGLQAAGVDVQDWTEKKLTSTLGNDVFNTLDLEATAKAVNKIGMDIIGGDDFDKALESGLVGYIKDTGLDDAAKDYAKTALASGAKAFYEGVLKPTGDIVAGLFDKVSEYDTPEGIKAIEDAVRLAGNFVDDEVLQPIKEGAESIYEPLNAPNINLPSLNVNLPDVNLPSLNVNLPDVNLPNMDMSGMFDGLMSYLPSQRTQPVAQQTTAPVLADLSNLYMEPTAPEELLATRDYLSGLLRTI